MLEFANALVLILLGAMLFFPSVVAPVVFTSLPEAQAGAFLRSMFPRYYAFMIALSLISASLFLVADGGSAYQAINTSNISRLLPCSGYWYWLR